MDDGDFRSLLAFFKTLADESRLRIIGVLANEEQSVEQLADHLGLQAPTVSHHLGRLRTAGLVQMRAVGNVHLYSLDFESLRALSKQFLEGDKAVSIVSEEPSDAYDSKVMKAFVHDGVVEVLPVSPKKRMVLLKWLLERFEVGKRYPEREVNELIKPNCPDFATIRRYFIEAGMMQRENGVYWRV
jgi:DNA-binding transcriptional ArsR family regulator